jgi:hypothetical protein
MIGVTSELLKLRCRSTVFPGSISPPRAKTKVPISAGDPYPKGFSIYDMAFISLVR